MCANTPLETGQNDMLVFGERESMAKLLTFQMLTESEQDEYIALANKMNRKVTESHERKAHYYFDKMTSLKSLLFPPSMMINAGRAAYHSIRAIPEIWQITNMNSDTTDVSHYVEMFGRFLRKHKCRDVNWERFPHPPLELEASAFKK